MERLRPTTYSHAERNRAAPVSANNRSRITNGAIGIDMRSATGRRWRDLYLDLMHRTGGRSQQLCRSAASLIVRREALDTRIAAGEDVATDELLRLVSELRRVLSRLGLDAEDEPEDATERAIAAARASLRGEVVA